MTKPATILREVGEVAIASPIFVTAPVLRHWHMRWGATDDEVASRMPGDDLVPKPSFSATRAITIDAPTEVVWPWVVQAGFGRAGFYSYDLLDNACRPSAEEILPEYQSPEIGDWVPMARKVSETTAFRIAAVDAGRSLLWEKPHSTWAWLLTPMAGGQGTRLVTRLRDSYPWRSSPGIALMSVILFELGDFPMMRRMLFGIKNRAEGEARNG